jgi:hypothetical protein
MKEEGRRKRDRETQREKRARERERVRAKNLKNTASAALKLIAYNMFLLTIY